MPDFVSTEVDGALVAGAAASIEGYINELQSICKYIETGAASELSPHWQGLAKDGFARRAAGFAFELNDLIAGYRELNEMLKQAGAAYCAADESVANAVASLPA